MLGPGGSFDQPLDQRLVDQAGALSSRACPDPVPILSRPCPDGPVVWQTLLSKLRVAVADISQVTTANDTRLVCGVHT